jgi:integrase
MASIDTIDPDGNRLPAGSKAPKGARYRARWRTPTGASRTKTFDRKVDAEQFLARMTVSAAEGSYIDPSEGRRRFGVYAASWAAAQPHRETTADSVATLLRVHILPTFGDRQLASIRTSEVQAWIAGLELAPSTVETVYGKLRAIFAAAVEDRLIGRTPCSRSVKLPRAAGAEVVPMAPAQVRAMVEAVGDRYSALLVLLAGSGLRPGEGLGLTVDRVDFLRRTIRVDRQLVTISGQPARLGPPKTPQSVRTIPVPNAVIDELARHLEQCSPGPFGLIFTDGKADPIRRNALGHVWRRAALKAGIDGFTPHDLRHYAASVLIDQGASVKAVQRHLGHASASTTLDTYAHLWPESEDVTRRALGAGLAGVLNHADEGGLEDVDAVDVQPAT